MAASVTTRMTQLCPAERFVRTSPFTAYPYFDDHARQHESSNIVTSFFSPPDRSLHRHSLGNGARLNVRIAPQPLLLATPFFPVDAWFLSRLSVETRPIRRCLLARGQRLFLIFVSIVRFY